MPHNFQLTQRVGGIAVKSSSAGERAEVLTRELVGPTEPHLISRLEQLQLAVFDKIPGLPAPSMIDHLLVLIRLDLSGIALVNELHIKLTVTVNRSLEAGSPIFVQDITTVSSVDLGVHIPPENGVILVRSVGWRKSLFFDFGPLLPDHGPRVFSIEEVLAQQESLLLGLVQPAIADPVCPDVLS